MPTELDDPGAIAHGRAESRPGGPPMISVVVPTRNRPACLRRLLDALAAQERRPDEVVIVDASDAPAGDDVPCRVTEVLPIVYMRSRPGVCVQRNLGIRRARGSYVLLCDDDIEPPPDYLRRLSAYLEAHPTEGAVTGALCEPGDSGGFAPAFATPSLRHLAIAFVFQLTVWADVESVRGGMLRRFPVAALRYWYRCRGNTWSLAGWPLVTQVRGPVAYTAIYGLGAALVRRDWLLASPFDERLGTHGIGDNYGVALGFPGERPIAVLVDLPVRHHRATENRIDAADAYYQRVLALDCFLRTRDAFSRVNTFWLAWSLVGKALIFGLLRRRDMLRQTLRGLAVVVRGRNPLNAVARDGRQQDAAAVEAGQ